MLHEPKCFTRKCKHFLGIAQPFGREPEEHLICEAFKFSPGIPEEIAYGSNKHTEPYPGDNGIQYEKE
jgi:hypothetical protein